jgi:hypothetical protein
MATSLPAPEIHCPLLWSDLDGLDPQKVASLSGAEIAAEGYKIRFLGREHLVDAARRLLIGPADRRPIGFLKTMVVLSYLAKSAQGPAPGLASVQAGAFELPGGTMFFRGPHALPEEKLIARFGQDPKALTARALELGASEAPPAAFLYRVLPFVELGLYLNPADEEFPAQVQWTFDRHAHFYLALDGLWGLALLIVGELAETD